MTQPMPVKRLDEVLRMYGCTKFRISPCRSLYKKIAAYRISTGGQSLLLKPYHGSKQRLHKIYRLVHSLERQGFHNMPRWLDTLKGAHWIKKNGRLYYATAWLDGSPLGDEVTDYERLGETLARLHLILYRRPVPRSSCTLMEIKRFKKQHLYFKRHLREIKKIKKPLIKWFNEWGNQCRRLAEEAWNSFSHPEVRLVMQKEKPSVIHGDVTRPNIIANSEGLYLVDWECARYGSAYYEVAETLNNVSDFTVNRMQAFLHGYEKYRPVTPPERLIIASFFRLPREVWICARQIRNLERTDLFDLIQKSWHRRLEAISWMDNWAMQARESQLDTDLLPPVTTQFSDQLSDDNKRLETKT